MADAKLTSKGQLTLPKHVRDDLNLKPGDRIAFVKEGAHYRLKPRTRSAMERAGALHRPDMATIAIEDMDAAVGQASADEDERIRAGH